MTKTELIDIVSSKTGLKKKDAEAVINESFSAITEALANGDKCSFGGFGVFETRDRAAREGRNPQNPTEVIKIPARKAAVFKPAKQMKERISAA